MSRKFLTTEEAFDYLMSLADESDDSDPEMIILLPDTDIVTDDEELMMPAPTLNMVMLFLTKSFKKKQLERALDLLEFRRHITIAYLGLYVPRNIAGRNLGIQQKNSDYLKLQSEDILAKIPNGKQRQLKNCTKKKPINYLSKM
ncbi:hypothetical protein AVEN_174220-1 [Araneus ventricosus]|uniref:Uncharacterized protein n=1 Tax=Araneus ventricosus TaxID=182803 RepID=A0A4Y2IV62_ARAVE|nr:hypothetical protein AVEN_174220-1 [Araneus ventricosus]